ncbi:MAG: Glu-tRNA(Gln) amidotransferase subunit GatE [Candidatus Pacearchaeota archaeon]|nr:Glu-tRNA(Gln) amidotransferase subunit GatE [Candidatus Pacearchaeota archaeon]
MEINYQKVGLKCGLEIHQQLDTKKLFCNCQSVLRKDQPDFTIKRKLHAVAGESGQIDKAAKYHSKLDKTFIYEGYDSTCLIELDEEPPHEINKEALKIAIQVSLLLNAKIIPITQIMRKTVIDGSNTSGFQRTVMIAHCGYIDTKEGKVRVDSICLEEDAARKISQDENTTTYKLDRLGIPLIEIATAPDIKTPTQAKETALKIGEILRSCKVKRGIGTIRQDVNVSIKKSNRVEIKGFQDPSMMMKTIDNEIVRQQETLKIKQNDSEVRNALPDGTTEFLRPMPGKARMYPETDLPLLKISRNFINDAKKTLPKLRSELEEEYKKKGLSEEMIKLLFKRQKLEEFKSLLNFSQDLNFVAKMILLFPKEISKRINKNAKETEDILGDYYIDILKLIQNKKITQSDVKDILIKLTEGKDFSQAIKIEKRDSHEIEEQIMKIIKEKPNLSDKAYMGLVMKEFKGAIDGKTIMEIIRKHLV